MLISKIAFLLSEMFLVILLLFLKSKKENSRTVSSHIAEENYSPFLIFCCALYVFSQINSVSF